MKLVFEGHACFRIISKGTEILIDPYISGNPLCKKSPEEFHPELILVTHGHGDHFGDALEIARDNKAVLAGQVDMLNAVDHSGLDTVRFNMGGSFTYKNFKITMVPAWHGNGIAAGENNIYAGVCCGYIIGDGEKKVYHAGDTCLFGDMSMVISRYGIDCALLPIGDFYTMGPEDAAVAASWLKAKKVIPMHYNTFPPIHQDEQAFKKLVEKEAGCECILLKPGEEQDI